MTTTARNVAIVLAIAAAFTFLPGGGDVAAILSRTLEVAMVAVVVWGLAWGYRRFRMDLEALPTAYRGLLYGAVGALVLTFAARSRLTDTGSGSLAFIAVLVAAGLAIALVWREHRTLS